MYDIIKKNDNDIISALHHKDTDLSLYMPFLQNIFLLDTYISGTQEIKQIELLEKKLTAGTKTVLLRNTNDPEDPYQIEVYTEEKNMLGCIPRIDTPVLARLLDAGKVLYGEISEYYRDGGWIQINLKIYMED